MTNQSYDAIILGAGGAGLMCAGIAGQRGKKVLLIDHAEKPGKKILISGGGRCNFTNTKITAANYISANPHFAKAALGRYTPNDFIDLVKSYNIAYHEKTLGQLFCDGSASQIVDMLLSECNKGGVDIKLGSPIESVENANGIFTVQLNGKTYSAPSFVIATGGPSIAKMGATEFAYSLGRKFGLKIVEPKPALVPFTLGEDEALFKNLSGVAAPVETKFKKTKFKEAALFTHKGLSGPAILQISSYWKHGEPITIDFFPDTKQDWLLGAKNNNQKLSFKKLFNKTLPERLTNALLERLQKDFKMGDQLGATTDKNLRTIEQKLSNWSFNPNGTEGFAKAEVTLGGISTAELSSKTMEANKLKGLYVIGEAVDVTGWLGGYNFQWAWASGYSAGIALG
ncbi:MAG: NAD(P)/FAD-dependent oxidoreductase [Rhizobiales bacterium]|nr:NAD(P)/FAD-dependent oxidoreductase [Hyphomicrobiales bacterium]